MLHLFPIRFFLQLLAAAAAIIVVAALSLGWIGTSSATAAVFQIIRWTSMIAVVAAVFAQLSWRWIPPLQGLVFPYLGGYWAGTLEFTTNNKIEQREVGLQIRQNLLGLRLLLESPESTSSTLAVHAERNDFSRFRMYYVYLNERKEGIAGGGDRYRGLAVIRVVLTPSRELYGNYFTENLQSGTLRLKLRRATEWWRVWR